MLVILLARAGVGNGLAHSVVLASFSEILTRVIAIAERQ